MSACLAIPHLPIVDPMQHKQDRSLGEKCLRDRKPCCDSIVSVREMSFAGIQIHGLATEIVTVLRRFVSEAYASRYHSNTSQRFDLPILRNHSHLSLFAARFSCEPGRRFLPVSNSCMAPCLIWRFLAMSCSRDSMRASASLKASAMASCSALVGGRAIRNELRLALVICFIVAPMMASISVVQECPTCN